MQVIEAHAELRDFAELTQTKSTDL
jgi:hypothetical protein